MTVLGAGVRTPFILHGLVDRQAELGLDEVVLHDVDIDRLDVMTALGVHLSDSWGASFVVRGERDPADALADSRFVFSAIRVGQDAARALDEEIALRHGVLGQETTGPGGFAMALRTIPVALGYARLIETVAPEAVLVNFTNPVGIVVQALNDHSSVRAIGVCDGPIEMKRGLAAFLGVPGDEVQVSYAGLNHCGWIHRVRVDGRDRLPEILDRYEELHATGESWSMFDPALVRTIGMLPMEYLYFYYYRREALEHVRASGGTRGRQVADLNASMWPELGRRIAAGDPAGARAVWERAIDERHETYFARERGDAFRTEAPGDEPGELFEGDGYEGVATAVMASIIGDRRAPLIVNARNDGAIEGLRADDVVEVTCDVDGDGAHAMEQGRLPDAAYALIEPVKAYERLTVEAAVEGSYGAALEALLVHPLVGSYRLSKDILDEYLAAHGDLLAHIRR